MTNHPDLPNNAPQWLRDADIEWPRVTVDKDGAVTWLGGVWIDGTWHGDVWHGGTWRCGTWYDGVWRGGTWYDGVWRGGMWRGGTWFDWRGGTWHNDGPPNTNKR